MSTDSPNELNSGESSALSESVAGCFLSGTKISLPNGQQVPIEQLKVGDIILSYNTETQSMSESKITNIYHGTEANYLIVNESLSITLSHLVYVNQKWIPAREIHIGDYLQKEDGSPIKVIRLELIDSKIEIYNIVLETGQTLFAHEYLVSDTHEESTHLDLVNYPNFFAEHYLVTDFAAKIAVINSPFNAKNQELMEASSLVAWWNQVVTRLHYSCYGIFLLLPSDKEAIRYITNFSDELDLISAADCLIITMSSINFQISNLHSLSKTWSSVLETQITDGQSIKVANLFNIDYDEFPCLLLFKDIWNEERLTIRLHDRTAEEVATLMRRIFSIIHKAVREKQDPLIYLEKEKAITPLIENTNNIMLSRSVTGVNFGASIKKWISEMMRDEQKQSFELLRIKKTRLYVLEQQAARYGMACPAHIVIEIDRLQEEIASIVKSISN